MAALAPIPLIPARRPRSPEIIDVDALDDDILFAGYARRSVRPRLDVRATRGSNEAGPSSRSRTIIVLDSDDESASTSTVRRSPARRRHRLFSPPPRRRLPQAPPPPVPPLPSNIATANPPVIVPNPNPLPFEARMQQDRHRHNRYVTPPPRPAPPSHHQPAMGLGGALIALNRQNEIAEQNRRARDAQRRAREARSGHRWITHHNLLGDLFGDDLLDTTGLLGEFGYHFNFMKPPAPKSAPWKSSYTHGGDKPPPGITYQFDMSDQSCDRGSSSSQAILIPDDDDDDFGEDASDDTPTLVCACCSDALLLSESLDEEDSKSRKVWALRCGHMLDGKCIDRLMRPPPPPETAPNSHQTPWQARRSRKGKGKAVDHSHLIPTCVEQATGTQQPEPAEPVDNSYRSRLRSSRMAAITAGISAVASAVSEVSSLVQRTRGGGQASSAKASPRAKGKGRARKPLATHEFHCPVEGCGRLHRSVLMPEADWKMDSAEGAVAVFV